MQLIPTIIAQGYGVHGETIWSLLKDKSIKILIKYIKWQI